MQVFLHLNCLIFHSSDLFTSYLGPRRPAVSLFSFPNRPTENHFFFPPSFPSSPNLLIKSISKVNGVNDVKGNEIHGAYFKPVIKACRMCATRLLIGG